MALDMLKRSLQLLGGSAVSAGKNYFSDVNTFVSDSKAIGAEMKDVISKPFDFVRKMSTSRGGGGLYKFVNDWFYQRTSEFDDGDDDFDSGMPSTDSHGSGTANTESTTLDTKAMKSIAHQQIGAMYQIGQKQVQANLASTAEIVTNNNARSTEIVTAINNLNKSVLSISESLKTIVSNASQESKYNRTDATNIFSGSNLTLGAVYEAAKTAGGENPFLMATKEMVESFKQGPQFITDQIVGKLAESIKIGNKSLQEQAEGLNRKFSDTLDSALSRLMQTSGFKFIFGDDFTRLNTTIRAKDEYTRDKAVFDMMTRKTIVDIIPEYLKKITHALTGETWNVNKRGKLTTDKVDIIGENMSSVLQYNAFGNNATSKLTENGPLQSNGDDIPPMILDQILIWISMGYTATMLEWATVFNNKANGLNQSPAAMLDKNGDIRKQAFRFAWSEYKKKYGVTQHGIKNESDFEKIFDEIISKVLFDPTTQKQFSQAVKSNVHSVHSMGIQLGNLGYDVGTLDSKTLSRYASQGMDTYSKELQDKYTAATTKFETDRQGKDAEYLKSELKKYGLNPDDFMDGVGTRKKLNEFKAIGAIEEAIKDRVREEYRSTHPDENTADLKHSLYARTDKEKLNIGSMVYDILTILRKGVPVYGVKKPKEKNKVGNSQPAGNGGIPSGLNLNTNGCGPIALNDLANRMAMNGWYDPNNGTTVGGFINQANQMGMNLQPGRVTQQALRNTSPNHPITVMGSGYGFGTLPGQNHYMNITGYGNGYVYTYNPMYGSGYYPIGAVANNSILGLYGSGNGVNINGAVSEAQDLVSESIENLNKVLNDIEPTSILGKAALALGISSKATKAGTKVNEKLGSAGNRTTSLGSKWKGIKGTVGDYFSYKKQLISDDVHNMLDTAIENNNRRAAIIERSEDYRKGKLSEIENGSYSERDRQLAQQALAMMQTALQDGDGQSDLTRIKNVVNKIKDRELRKDLNDNITGMINGAKKNAAQPKSKLGKIVLFGFGLLKKFLSPVFKGAKLLFMGIWKSIKGVFGFVKNYGAKLIKWLARPYLKGAAKVGAGIKGLTQGLFGWTETGADGTTEKRAGLLTPVIKMIALPVKMFAKGIKGLTKLFGVLGNAAKFIGGKFVDLGKSIGNFFKKNVFGKISGWFNKRNKNKTGKSPFTQFGKGLKAGWKGVKDDAAERAAKFDPKSKENTPKSMTDQNTTTIAQLVGNIVSILRGEDPQANKNKEEEKEKEKQTEEEEDAKNETEDKATGADKSTEGAGNKSGGSSYAAPEFSSTSYYNNGSSDNSSQNSTSSTGSSDNSNSTSSSTSTSGSSDNSQNAGGSSDTSTSGDNSNNGNSGNAGNNGNANGGGNSSTDTGNRKSPLFKIGNILGKIGGGITSIYGGLFKIVATAAMQLSAFKVLTKLVKEVITTAIKPLNKLFKTLVKEIKPILKTITTALTELVESAVQVLSVLFESIGPFLEPLFNVVTDIMGSVGDVLIKGIGQIIGLLTPAVNFLLKILVPLIKGIHAAIETVTGAIQVVMGKVLYGIGAMIAAADIFKLLKKVGPTLMRTGNELVESGSDKFYTGIARGIDTVATVFHGTTTVADANGNTTSTSTTINNYDNSTTNNNSNSTTINENAYEKYPEARGMSKEDVTAAYGEAVAQEIYGSGDSQASYGTFMNMKERGCGPIALAENINRRNLRGVYGSGDIDPRSLASSMYSAGMYSTDRGTSVGDYISTANALGYGMQVGGVDYRSLKQASPTNPITLVGSGDGFGTRMGNTHYINVVGSDGGGYAYVSNPLTGRISKASMSQLALNSKLGIYGSGDEDETPDYVKDNVSKAFEQADKNAQNFSNSGIRVIDNALNNTTLGVVVGGIKKLLGTEATTEDRQMAVEQLLHSGKYSSEEAALIRKYADNELSGNTQTMVTRTEDNTTSSMDDLSDISNIDFSAESISDRFGTSSTISTLIGGLKDLASNFLSIFNSDDVSTEEGQQKYLKRVKKELGEIKFNIIRAYAFMQFYKDYPPTAVEGLTPGTASAKIYAARFKLHEYEYFVKYREKVESNWSNLAPLFPSNELMALAAEVGYREFAELFGVSSTSEISRLSNLTIPQLAQGICAIIDGLSDEGAVAAISRATGSTNGVNSSSAEWNSLTFTQADGLRYRVLNYTPRTTIPEDGNVYYNASGKNPSGGWTAASVGGYSVPGKNMLSNCSGYAIGRFHEEVNATKPGGTYFLSKFGSRNGKSFIDTGEKQGLPVDREGKYPRPGDTISWDGPTSSYNHVAIVEEVPDPDTIIIAHSSYSGFKGKTGTEKYFKRDTLKRGNANNMWPWGKYHFLGFVHNPDIDFELANNGTSVYEYEGGKIPHTDWTKSKSEFNAYNSDLGATYKDALDKSGYHTSAVSAGLTPAEEAYVAGVGIHENGAKKLVGYTPVTKVTSTSDANKTAFGIFNWKAVNPKNGHDYTYGSNLTEQLASIKKRYFGQNPEFNRAYVLKDNYSGYSNALKTVLGTTQLKLQSGDSWGGYLNNDLRESTGHGVGNAIVPGLWKDPEGHAIYIGNAIDYYNHMIDNGWVTGSNLPTFSSTDWRYAAPLSTTDWMHAAPETSTTSSTSTSSTTSKKSSTSTTSTSDDTLKKYKLYSFKYDSTGNSGSIYNVNGEKIASALNVFGNKYADQAIKGKTHMSAKWNDDKHDWWYYNTLDGHEIYGAGDTPTSTYIPKLNTSNLYDSMIDDGTRQTNNYYIAKDSSDSKREELNILLNHTFNVRSDSMEAILTEMLSELKKRGNARTSVSVPSPETTPSLFDDQIPESIVRLMNG